MKIKRLIATVLACCMIFSILPSFVSAQGPTLKEGNHEAWIDRLGDMPQYALDFYDWLVENSKKGGALRTAIGETNFTDGTSAHLVAEIQGNTNAFTFPIGASNATIQTNAINSCAQNRDEIVEEAKAFIFATAGAFDRDYSQVFWLSGDSAVAYSTGYSWAISRTTGYGEAKCTVKIFYILKSSTMDVRASKYSSEAKINEADDKMNACIEEILSGEFPNNGTYFEKVAYLNDWLTKNNCFNTADNLSAADSDCRECISALTGSIGTSGPICEGYSRAFKVLCDKINIPCVLVDGEAFNGTSSGGHMWNYVQMENGEWYALDVSWNDPTVSGVSSAVSGYENRKYFLVGSDTIISDTKFIVSHPVSNTVYKNGFNYTNGPALSTLSYQEYLDSLPAVNFDELKIDANLVTISNQINMEFAVIKTDFDAAGFKNPKVEAVFCGETYILEPQTRAVSGIVCYVFTFENIAPQMMGEYVSVSLKAEFDGENYTSGTTRHSVAEYAYTQLKTTANSKFRTLLVDMLHYGRCAQEYTSYKTYEPIDGSLTATQASWGTQSLRKFTDSSVMPDFNGSATWVGMGLNLENKVAILGYFDVPMSTGNYVKVTNINGVVIDTITQEEFSSVIGPKGTPVVAFEFNNLAANQMSDVLGFTVYNAQGQNISGTYLFSIESYVKKAQSSASSDFLNLINSMMLYGDSARAYAG